MTERPHSITTQQAATQVVFTSIPVPGNDALEDTEDYVVKCICTNSEANVDTVCCDQCDTWQHIECYYPNLQTPEEHFCVDCSPRPLQHADTNDKKKKGTSHKRKPKPSDVQVNGYHEPPHEHIPHTKKTKGHRASHSVGSLLKRSPPLHARPHNHAHPPSPAHTPPDLPNNFQVHGYSEHFQSLYDQDRSSQGSTSYSFASLQVTNTLALWLHEPEKLHRDAGVDKEDVFQFLTVPANQLKWPELRVADRKEITDNGTTLQWRQLITPTNLPQAGRIGELNGQVGFQKDYCDDQANRWTEFAHPLPFVFFHSRLPLYIDTRIEGSTCRYVRRSCRPNTNLEIFIALGNEYHWWLTSERALAANEQITIPWDFRFPAHIRSRYLHLLNLSDDDGAPFDGSKITQDEYEQLSQTIYSVLSDYGGCACDLGNDCAFVRFHRHYHGRSQSLSNGVKSKKGGKVKQNHVSPTSTGHATNSRAASEGQQGQYDDDDGRSISGSVRSKPHSRDLTPSQGVGETNDILESAREKRKIAALEDSFRKMEQEPPTKKKKRASDSSAANVLANTTIPQVTPKSRQRSVAPRMSISQPTPSNVNGHRSRQYVDASTSRRQSGSPASALSPAAGLPSPNNQASRGGSTAYRSRQASAIPKSTYADASAQTDEVENAWWNEPRLQRRRSIIPLSKRLLRNRHKQLEAKACLQATNSNGGEEQNLTISPTASTDLDVLVPDERYILESPTDAKARNPSISSTTSVEISPASVDVAMVDPPPTTAGTTIKPPPPPWPVQSSTAIGGSIHFSPRQKSPDLRVQMPPAPVFSTPNMSGPLSGPVTPSPGSGSISQSPLGTVHPPGLFAIPIVNGQHTSPVKTTKKLSLSDYKAARMKKSDPSAVSKAPTGSSPTVAPAVLKPSLSTAEEARTRGMLEGSAIIDSPMAEKLASTLGSTAGWTSDSASHHDVALKKRNGTL